MSRPAATHIGRRAFLKGGTLVLAAGLDAVPASAFFTAGTPGVGGVRFGLLTDLHCADKPPAGILDHCRSDGPHARGCWVVDLLLSKE
jgi:hypothetical protein